MPDMLSLIALEWPLGCRVIKVSDETACKRQKKAPNHWNTSHSELLVQA